MKKVLKKVLEDISLSKKERSDLTGLANEAIREIKKAGGNAFIGGSLAKGTLVKKEKQDIDIFVVFKKESDIPKLAKILKKAKLDVKVVHGSRDYYHLDLGDILIEIIPVVAIKKPEDATNVTDVSLMHVKYISKKLKMKKRLVEEIALAKTFCFANRAYGAESYIGGFSGYSLEVLVSYFGSFIKFLKGVQKKRVIDPEKYFKNDKEIFRELNESKLQSPIVLIDPTYKYGNVCAGLQEDTFKKFLEVSKSFLRKPSADYFVKRVFKLEDWKNALNKEEKIFEVSLSTNRQEGDIAGTKMKKFFNFLIEELGRKEQEVIESEFIYESGQLAKGYLILKEKKEISVEGPEKYLKEAVKEFKKAHKDAYESKGRFYTKKVISLDEILNRASIVAGEMGVGVSLAQVA